MKVTKQSEQALLVKPFGVNSRFYLSCSVLICFDLMRPTRLLQEKDLWTQLTRQIGRENVLDMGMPKPRAEVLVTGKCFAPQGTSRPAAEIAFQVGPARKKLSVFGNRYWKPSAGIKIITDPEPFAEMPITWENAFGGEGFEQNPAGKGISPVRLPDGQTLVPLPNIEDPQNLIGSPSERPEPAGFGPIDVTRPRRFKKQGTYDEKWQRERWPHFPDDMDFEFFNTAPEDQFIDGFFRGDEAVEVMNMHPEIQLIQSRLPGLRIRCFVTKKKDLGDPAGKGEVFEEVQTRIDTVWLFPDILKGLVLYRGTTEIRDEEYADVRRIFLATEKMAGEPQPIEYYLEQQRKALDRKVPVNTAPLEAARKKLAEAMKRIKSMPRDIEEAKLAAMGKRPVMRRSPEEMAARSRAVIGKSLATIAGLEKLSAGLQARYGHRVKIDLARFSELREKIKGIESRLDQNLAGIQKAVKEGKQVQQEIGASLKQHVDPEDLQKAGIDPDDLLPEKSVNRWHDHGFGLVTRWRKNLEQNRAVKNALYDLGFNRQTIKRGWFGFNPEELLEKRSRWGLAEQDASRDEQPPLVLPAGIVLPCFQDATLIRIKIRPDDYTDPAKEAMVEGSDETPLFLPAVEQAGAPVIRVSDELDAWFMQQEIGDVCSVVVLDGPGEKPAPEALEAIKEAPVFLVALPEKSGAEEEESAWAETYPDAKAVFLPQGKTVIDANRHGVDIRKWVMDALPEEYCQKHRIEVEIPEPGSPPAGSPTVSLPKIDVAGIVKKSRTDMESHLAPVRDEAVAESKKLEELARKEMARHGMDFDKVAAGAKVKDENPAAAAMSFLTDLAKARERLKTSGHLTSGMEAEIDKAEDLAKKASGRASELYRRGMAQLKKTEQLSDGRLPDWAKKIYALHGADRNATGPLTREQVIEDYRKGKSFDGKNLSGLDLSGLDLRGIDLRKARCNKTNFSKTILDDADLSGILAKEADFSKASMQRIFSKKGVFTKSFFKEADLTGADLDMVSMQETDLEKANLNTAKLKKVMFLKADLSKAVFTAAVGNMCIFIEAEAAEVNFNGARLIKCMFQKAAVDLADFSGAVLDSTMFYAAKGSAVRFAEADLSRARMGGGTVLAGADFSGVTMKQGCFRDADLSGADFSGARIEETMLENCDLQGANLLKVVCVKTRFSKSNLEGADMRGVNLFLGSLRKARLVNTDLRGANLFGVDFYKAVMGSTRLEGANCKLTLIRDKTEYLS